jgi:hypothetical protein
VSVEKSIILVSRLCRIALQSDNNGENRHCCLLGERGRISPTSYMKMIKVIDPVMGPSTKILERLAKEAIANRELSASRVMSRQKFPRMEPV